MHLRACSHFLIPHVSGQPVPVIEEYISRDTAILLKLNATSVVMNTIKGGQVLLVEQTAGNREKREATSFSSAVLLNVSLEGGRFLYVLGLMPGQDYSFEVARWRQDGCVADNSDHYILLHSFGPSFSLMYI